MMNDYQQAKMMHEIIDKMVHKLIRSQNLLSVRVGEVVSYDSVTQKAEVVLAGDSPADSSFFLNKTGQNLVSGDGVYILILDGSLTNSFIAWKKGLYQ